MIACRVCMTCMYGCVCVCARAHARTYVCVCVYALYVCMRACIRACNACEHACQCRMHMAQVAYMHVCMYGRACHVLRRIRVDMHFRNAMRCVYTM